MWVVDRPGFGCSEPAECVPDLAVQTAALGPLLDCAPGQRVLLVGQSYGAAIAALMAAARPDKVGALVLLSGLFGEMGPTAAGLVDLGRRVHGVIPRDLRNAITEVRAQPPQLLVVREALSRLSMPIHIVHGEDDDFAPIAAARALAQSLEAEADVRFAAVPGADHFLNEGPPELLLSHLEAAIASASPEPRAAPGLGQRLRAWFGGRKASLAALADRRMRRTAPGAPAAADR
jgi:pimeloyl-ACP methyl ester carboxylesterase